MGYAVIKDATEFCGINGRYVFSKAAAVQAASMYRDSDPTSTFVVVELVATRAGI
jgi:hypothetical protein